MTFKATSSRPHHTPPTVTRLPCSVGRPGGQECDVQLRPCCPEAMAAQAFRRLPGTAAPPHTGHRGSVVQPREPWDAQLRAAFRHPHPVFCHRLGDMAAHPLSFLSTSSGCHPFLTSLRSLQCLEMDQGTHHRTPPSEGLSKSRPLVGRRPACFSLLCDRTTEGKLKDRAASSRSA